MTRSLSPGGKPTLDVASYYRRRAESDVGPVLSEEVLDGLAPVGLSSRA